MTRTFILNIVKPMMAGLFAFLSLVSFCQKELYFSGDSAKFTGELNSIFGNLADNEKKIIAPSMEDFYQKWKLEKFNASYKKIIYAIFNEMALKKIRPYPDFFSYVNALNIFINTNQALMK